MSRLDFRHVATRLLRSQSQSTQPLDADLLARFAATRDENAFAELVARHGGLVRGTACRCLRDPHSAEDVYQATFLVLARKAGTIQWMTTVGPWLHATAVRLSRKALCRTNPSPVAVPTEIASSVIDPATAAAWGDVCRVLDEELAALPEALRGPLVLCYLQSHTRDEAAHALGCSLAMLKRRLERGRNLLRERLTRRGLTFPAAGFGLLVCDMSVGAATVDATTRAAVAFATQGTASPGVAGLLEVSRGGFQLKAVALISVAVGLIACGIAFATFSQMASETQDGQKNPSIAAPKTDETSRANSPSEALPFAAVARLGSIRLRTRGAVERMAFSPDGTKIASWSGDSHVNNSLIVWDTKTGRALRRVDLPGARVDQLVWLADGRGIALVRSSYDDPVPFIWEFTDEKAKTPEVKPRGGIGGGAMKVPNQVEDNEHDACYAISPDGKMIVIGRAGELESDREVQLWELKTGVKTNALKPLKGASFTPATAEKSTLPRTRRRSSCSPARSSWVTTSSRANNW